MKDVHSCWRGPILYFDAQEQIEKSSTGSFGDDKGQNSSVRQVFQQCPNHSVSDDKRKLHDRVTFLLHEFAPRFHSNTMKLGYCPV